MSTEDQRVGRLQKALSQLEPVEYDACASRIAHESGVVLRCQRKHMRGTTNRMHVTKGGVCWRDDDERIVNEPEPVGSTPVSEEPAPRTVQQAMDELASLFVGARQGGKTTATRCIKEIYEGALARGISEGRRQAAVAIRAQAPATSVIEGGPDLMAWAAELAECPRCPLGICSAHRPAEGVSDVH